MSDFFDNVNLSPLFESIYNSDDELFVFAKDLDYQFTFINNALLKRLGLQSQSQIIGKNDTDFFDPNLADKYRVEDKKVFDNQSPVLNRIWHVPNGKGGIDWYISNKYPVYNQDRKLIGLLGIMRGSTQAAATLDIYADMSKVISHIQENYSQQIEIQELAKMVHLSKSQFARRFKSMFKMSPLRYINKVRIDVSCEKLINSNDGLSTIALDCGFYDHSYFTKIFKVQMEMTPIEYRENYFK
jgi:AraC-like DNA-binding protein